MKILSLESMSAVSILVILAIAILFIYMNMDGIFFGDPLKVNQIATTTKSVYSPGDKVSAKFTYCKEREIVGYVQWDLSNGTYINTKRFPWALGCFRDKIVVVGDLPNDIATGTYYFFGVVNFKINMINEVHKHIQTNKFTIK